MGYVRSKYSHYALKQTLTVGKFGHRELCGGGWKQAISSNLCAKYSGYRFTVSQKKGAGAFLPAYSTCI